MPSFISRFRSGAPKVPGTAGQPAPAGSIPGSPRNMGSHPLHSTRPPPKPPEATGYSSAATPPRRRSLADLMHQERPTELTASFLTVPPPPAPLHVPPRTTPGKNQPITNAAASHLGTQASDGTFVATGKWDGATAWPSAAPSRTEPLRRHETQEAGYQLGAKLNGNAIDHPDDRHRLAQANQTMHQTRLELKHGRGNVPDDIAASGGASAHITSTSYEIGDKYGTDAEAGAALAYGAANCDQNGLINSRLHAPKLGPGETTHTVGINGANMALSGGPTGHTFSELNAPPRQGWKKQGSATPQATTERPAPIVMDSWASGPAVRRQDSVYAPHADAIVPSENFDSQSGGEALKKMLEAKQHYSPGGGGRAESDKILSEKQSANGQYVPWNNVQVVSPQFARQAEQNLDNAGSFSSEIMAAGAGREAYNLSVAQATNPTTIDNIRHETANLNRQERPATSRPVVAGPSLNPTSVPGPVPRSN